MLETKKHNLIACPVCESRGTKSILGELGTGGEFIVQRFHQSYTIINSPLMSVTCSNCGEEAYRKDERSFDRGIGVPGWGTFQYLEFQGTFAV